MTDQPQKADRYTTLLKRPDELDEVSRACDTLGLYWFAMKERPDFSKCQVYVFFDLVGMRNYLRGHYEPEPDREDSTQ